MKTMLVMLALLLSSLSMALQLKKPKPAPALERFLVPARISELDHRLELANHYMIRESIVMRRGVGVPFIRQITDDRQHIIVRVLVAEEDLPKSHDERKDVLMNTAVMAFGSVVSAFDLKFEDHSTSEIVIVQFMSIRDLVKDNNKVYAEYKNGELSFH